MTPFIIIFLVCISAAFAIVLYIYAGRMRSADNFAANRWIRGKNEPDIRLRLGANIVTIGGGTGL